MILSYTQMVKTDPTSEWKSSESWLSYWLTFKFFGLHIFLGKNQGQTLVVFWVLWLSKNHVKPASLVESDLSTPEVPTRARSEEVSNWLQMKGVKAPFGT